MCSNDLELGSANPLKNTPAPLDVIYLLICITYQGIPEFPSNAL